MKVQYKAKKHKRQVTPTTQITTFQVQEATQATAGHEYILTIPDTQLVSPLAMQPTQTAAPQLPKVIANVQPQRSASVSSHPTSYFIVDDQQNEPSRQLMLALSPTKAFNPPLVSSGQYKHSQHNTSGLSSLFGSIPSILEYQQIDTPQLFSPSQLQPALLPVPTTTHRNKKDLPASPASRVSPS